MSNKRKSESSNSLIKGTSGFVKKMYDMVSSPDLQDLVSWNEAGDAFIVKNEFLFSSQVMKKYFRHQNFASFVRQLNFYGFHKRTSAPSDAPSITLSGGSNQTTFFHPNFRRDQPELLYLVHRKAPAAAVKPGGASNFKEELGALKSQLGQLQQQYTNLFEIERKILYVFNRFIMSSAAPQQRQLQSAENPRKKRRWALDDNLAIQPGESKEAVDNRFLQGIIHQLPNGPETLLNHDSLPLQMPSSARQPPLLLTRSRDTSDSTSNSTDPADPTSQLPYDPTNSQQKASKSLSPDQLLGQHFNPNDLANMLGQVSDAKQLLQLLEQTCGPLPQQNHWEKAGNSPNSSRSSNSNSGKRHKHNKSSKTGRNPAKSAPKSTVLIEEEPAEGWSDEEEGKEGEHHENEQFSGEDDENYDWEKEFRPDHAPNRAAEDVESTSTGSFDAGGKLSGPQLYEHRDWTLPKSLQHLPFTEYQHPDFTLLDNGNNMKGSSTTNNHNGANGKNNNSQRSSNSLNALGVNLAPAAADFSCYSPLLNYSHMPASPLHSIPSSPLPYNLNEAILDTTNLNSASNLLSNFDADFLDTHSASQ
jgi:hypothetical protein